MDKGTQLLHYTDCNADIVFYNWWPEHKWNICPLLLGDVLLATGFLSYSGPFNQEFRNLLLSEWQQELKQRHIPFGVNLNLTEMLIDSPTISEWNLQVSDLFC